MIFWVAVFILSLGTLIKSSDYFTGSAEKLGIRLGLPHFIVGVTVVAIGTSLPELASSVAAVAMGSPEIVAGNVVGSNITNIFLIIGLSGIVGKKITIQYDLLRVDLPLLIASAFMLAILAYDGSFSIADGVISIAGLAVYLGYAVTTAGDGGGRSEQFSIKDAVVLAGSAILLYLSAEYTVRSVVEISHELGVGAEIIAATAVALGTSLPELSVSLMAARRGKSEMAIGNILGSNIFNSFGVTGISALFGTVIFPETIRSFALPLMVVATLLYFFMTQDRQMTRWEGGMLVIFYVYYLGRILGFM
ncbi:calcium/sodium antiporter [Geoglobus acetivorans]|uniref:Sodium/calcium exchanger n=1 Tax=Geoglobus acetivorans TaxID=565033 RepID=A0A0A7GIL2_GEOAI|nr:Sodium/calcium exchanger [Geoglobus acetivorans]